MKSLVELYAHTPSPEGKWDYLDYHLQKVAELAASFAGKFNASDPARIIGILHDFGKINSDFQDYLIAQFENRHHKKAPHAIWGAALMYFIFWCTLKDDTWKEFVLPICGHHGGLEAPGLVSQKLSGFLKDNPSWLKAVLPMWEQLQKQLIFSSPVFKSPRGTSRELHLRMLFSALTDADYLATEEHFSPQNTSLRGEWPELLELWELFREDQNELLKEAEKKPTKVNRVRREVYDACLRAGPMKPGVFRLTVPTGGGKTRSGLAFALKHAIQDGNDLKRIIIALPYTSIIDQTAREYRKILEKKRECVLEHHSQIDVPDDNEDQSPKHLRHRLASENWDSPVIVTTTVQLFESLFSNKPGRVRKIHNIAKSVLILDEVQTLPPNLLKPMLDVLIDLVKNYGVSLVLSTATQPVFENKPFLEPFVGVEIKEIVPDFPKHFADLKRVNYFRSAQVGWVQLAKELRKLDQVMVVLNTRKDALALIEALGDAPDIFHLSTLLCGRHRNDKLQQIRLKLKARGSVRLISTQVVEAGVDLDFPVVYRAFGPLDRIVQAAGRCNREGGPVNGRVVIFEPSEGRMPRGPYFAGYQKSKMMLDGRDPDELNNPLIFQEYFRLFYGDLDLDELEIQVHRQALDYPRVADLFRLIPYNTLSVVVRYGSYNKHLKNWEISSSRATWRRLQPFIISVFDYEAESYLRDGIIEDLGKNLYIWNGKYDNTIGAAAEYDPADLIQ
ncbi:CRISPR-associated helicase, Cas3 family [Syntrophobacter sp. SbD2]|nr:CRISPR-associated helicase, Cas3 family [Syntrophobacter sp. SbD2]